ncbi:DUF2971 domain-containing protein [Methylobacter sp. YRD-M1]|uniref:DUF2971 domain-containing protein n=1 Tax=Methylobacter sp. YRD-M1 TaxID=2911520 RepID=UPI00227A7A10|nr:DUF2971 domain-containing protein [Methylobacter sp. YRD-M1]WAK03607.1 DUF2971 domain-containing protein [Methylobacter sp. YRD-M1]
MDTNFQLWLRRVSALPYFERRLALARWVRPRLHRFLYKYKSFSPADDRSIDHLRDIVVRSRLWLSSPIDFNDPFDMSASIVAAGTARERRDRFDALAKANGVKWRERKLAAKKFARRPVGDIEEELQSSYQRNLEDVGVFSFAGDARSILMWSHYANNHTGVCFQFERARDFATLSGALTVEYSAEYPEVNWLTEFAESLGKVLLRKHEGWAYEMEERIVRPGDARKHLSFAPAALVGMIIGCRAHQQHRELAQALLEERAQAGLPAVKLYEAVQHRTEYRLSIVNTDFTNKLLNADVLSRAG